MDPTSAPLAYQSPTPPGVISITQSGEFIRVELDPPSAGTSVASIFPALVSLGVSFGLVGLVFVCRYETALCVAVFAAIISFVAGTSLWESLRHRNKTRFIWVSPDRLGYRDIRSGDSNIYLSKASRLKPARVVQSRLRPWAYLLIADPPFFALTFFSVRSITLAIDTDRALLESLLPLIDAARQPAPQHVRGAFEVIPVVKRPIEPPD